MKLFLQNKWISILLLAIGFSLIYNPLTKFPYTFCVIIFFILSITYMRDGNLNALNFRKLGSKELKIIIIAYIALELSVDFVFQPLVNWMCSEPADYSTFEHIKDDTPQYFKWLYKMWISAAVGEELLFRAFAFAQLKNIFGDKKVIIAVISALMFCLPHLYQGVAGLMMTFLFGIAFAFLYMKFDNIWINILVHGLIDTVFLTLSYLGYLEFYQFIW